MKDSIIILKIALWASVIICLILDVLCYKYRKLASYYLYIHVAHLIITRMLPNNEG